MSWLEQTAHNRLVVGSLPIRSTKAPNCTDRGLTKGESWKKQFEYQNT